MAWLEVVVTVVAWWPWVGVALTICRIVAAFRPVPDWLIRGLRTVVCEVRPFYLPAMAVKVAYLLADGVPAWAGVLVLLMAAWNWWLFREKDDDRWKRRRRKVAEKVARVGSRLVAVPAGAP